MNGTSAGYTWKEVRDSFTDLKTAYDSGSMTHCTNYIPIRLVTLIEQFCRVAYKQRRLKYNWKPAPPPVTTHILIDIFQRFCPNIKYTDCELGIRMYGNLNYPHDDKVRLKSDADVQELVTTVLGRAHPDAAEWICLCMLSFQNVKSIKNKLNVLLSPGQEAKLNELFGRRHTVVHTLSDRQAGKAAFDVVESLFTLIENTSASWR